MMSASTSQLERSLQVYKGLVEVSALINAITDFDELLSAILDVAKRVMQAEASSLFLVEESGDLQLRIARGPDGETPRAQLTIPRGRGISGWVLENQKSLLIRDAYEDPRFYREVDKLTGFRTGSILCVPLIRDGRVIAVLQVLNPRDKPIFDETDLEALEAYSNLAATAIDKLQTLEQQRRQAALDQELAFAREIQHSFLPDTLPRLESIRFAATYRPARNIGGDFYDVLEVGPDEIYFVIGDVSGKGTPAALLMAQALSNLRFIVQPGIAPVDALTRWNRMLCGHTIRGMFITAILGRITPSTGRVELASAGHCTPLRLSAGGQVDDVRMNSAPPIGISPELEYRSDALTLNSAEWLVLYTDGLTESFDEHRVCLDRAGVGRILDADFASPDAVVGALLRGEQLHRGHSEVHDDLTLLVFGIQ